MAKIIIFGNNDTAQLAHYYLTHDSDHKVIGFTVHKAYYKDISFCGLPVYPFEELTERFSTDEVSLFAPMTGQGMNRQRQAVFEAIKAAGYSMISYVSSKATVLTDVIGENCFILEDNTLQPFVSIGDNVVLWSGNHIGHHSMIADHVFISSHVVICGHCYVANNCFLGVNASVRDGVQLAEGSFVAMAAVITKNTDAWAAYAGHPARKLRQGSEQMTMYHEPAARHVDD